MTPAAPKDGGRLLTANLLVLALLSGPGCSSEADLRHLPDHAANAEHEESYNDLILGLADTGVPIQVRALLAELVGHSEDKCAIPALIRFLDDNRPCAPASHAKYRSTERWTDPFTLGEWSLEILVDLLDLDPQVVQSLSDRDWNAWWKEVGSLPLSEIRRTVRQ